MRRWDGLTWMQIDVLFGMMLLFLSMMNPQNVKATQLTMTPNTLRIEVWWPIDACSDVDSWGLAPGGRPVGYSNKVDHGFALTRDDLGCGNSYDADSRNYEIMTAMVVRPGDYAFNLHLYRYRTGPLPIHCKVLITIVDQTGFPHPIIEKTVDLDHEDQEVTVARWEMDDKQQLVDGSVVDYPIALRAN